MTALTLRQIPSRVEKVIREKAAREHVSLNKAVVEMLDESIMGKQKNSTLQFHDLDWMCGIVSEKQGEALSEHISQGRTIDTELWK